MELRHRAAIALAVLAATTAWPAAPAVAAPKLVRPASETKPPHGYERSAREVRRIAARSQKVRAERARHSSFRPSVYTRGPGRWQVSWFAGRREVVQVRVDDRTGAILEQWSGHQVAWTMARGYEGAFGRKLNAPYVWLPLCLLFLAPFVDPRRPLRILHLDLLVLLAFGASHVFFNRGQIGISVPLVYPVLLLLLARLLWTGFRPRPRDGPLVPVVPAAWLAIGIVLLVGFRVGLNVLDSNVIDVGYAGVIGADRIADGDPLYGKGFDDDVDRGDTYGPLTYLLYVPFEQAMPWSGNWDGLHAAHGAALLFDLATLAGLVLLGRRLRPGRPGRELGLALGFAWAAYPYSMFALETNSNDSLVAALVVGALLTLTLDPTRRGGAALARGAVVGLAAAAKFGPLVLAPLLARGRAPVLFALALATTLAATFLPFLPDGGVRELLDRTAGYQASRSSPFSVWGQYGWPTGWQTLVQGAAVVLALVVAVLPRGARSPAQTAALAAAVLIAVQLGVTHWFYLYVVWFAPLALVAFMAPWRTAQAVRTGVETRPHRREALVG